MAGRTNGQPFACAGVPLAIRRRTGRGATPLPRSRALTVSVEVTSIANLPFCKNAAPLLLQ
jgi:hypothetical protein